MSEEPHILVVYGTRPEAIKVTLVILVLHDSKLRVTTLTTRQHPEMVASVNQIFGITPDEGLSVIRPRQSLNALAARVLADLDEKLKRIRPDAVLVQGDTTTVMTVALAAFNRGIKVAHLGTGLRSGSLALPFPEGGSRRLAGAATSLHLAPTPRAWDNLLHEDIAPTVIAVTGNTVVNALRHVITTSRAGVDLDAGFMRGLSNPGLKVLVTVHRRESWGKPIHQMALATRDCVQARPKVTFLLPAHANSQVRAALVEVLGGVENVIIGNPQPYAPFAGLLQGCDLVLTDSGGTREEVPALDKSVLVIHDTTERLGATTAGTAHLVGTSYQSVWKNLGHLVISAPARAEMAHAISPYGNGRAAARVVAASEELFEVDKRLPDFSVL